LPFDELPEKLNKVIAITSASDEVFGAISCGIALLYA
jgi:hypothetical protein